MLTKEKILESLKSVYDPEIPVNIVDLGLIYNIDIQENDRIYILMTLTAPGCPIYTYIEEQVRNKILEIEGVKDVIVEFTFDPPWTPDKITEQGKETLRGYGFRF